jgi:hypothetical protein
MTLNVWAYVGRVAVFPVASPNYADLGIGHSYGIYLYNSTDNPISAGQITVQTAAAREDNACEPGDWHNLAAVPDCSAPPGVNAGDASINLAETPVGAHSQCSFSFACPEQFLRLTNVPTGLTATVVVENLRRTDFSFGSVNAGVYTPWGQLPAPFQASVGPPAQPQQAAAATKR